MALVCVIMDLLNISLTIGVIRKQRRLLPGAVPSVFYWTRVDSSAAIARRRRASLRDTLRAAVMHTQPSSDDSQDQLYNDDSTAAVPVSVPDVVAVETVKQPPSPTSSSKSTSTEHIFVKNSSVQTDVDMPSAFLSYENLQHDPQLLHYYTGLETGAKLLVVFHSLGPAVYSLVYYRTATVDSISPLNQFILMLAKLRQDVDYLPLSKMCGVSVFTAENVFITWINFCSRQWSEVNTWPDKDLTLFYCPKDFKLQFPTTCVILDGTEIPIKKPSNPLAQRSTFSTYKNGNTVKVLIGCSPGGLISYVSPAYGGSVSDRQVVERSNLPDMCQPKDSIMADKGFNVQDLFAANDITVNIPTFFTKKNRMSGKQVLADRKISSKRVHVERVIGLMKSYKILTRPLNSSETKLSSHIVKVCAMLCNFRHRIVSADA